MPIYCYKCFDCNHYNEVKQKMSDEPLKICPECESDNYKRVIRNVGIIFKGSGFHITDYDKKSTNSSISHKAEEKKPAESPKAEAKPAEKPKTESTPKSDE